ncbi:MAG: molybdenum cofactor guanylyltransferase [Nitrospira sp.]|nr:molybdenum cofactor guanylyltransferase [Nitrospira sp.]
MVEREVTGVLLAGGQSRRMGEDKRHLLVGEQTLLERGLAVLRLLFPDVLVVIAQSSPPLDVEATVLRDMVPDCGSLGGLYTGLTRAETPYVFVVACDMPFLNPAVISQFIDRRDTMDIVMAKLGDQLHPMHALYGKRCLPFVQQMIDERQLKIQRLVTCPSLHVRYVLEEDLTSTDPSWRSFQNVNTPEDLAVARSLLTHSPPAEPR